MTDTSTATFLERIVAATRAELAERQARLPLEALRARAASAPPPRDFVAALNSPTPARRGGKGERSARLIAEVKRASPSRGLLSEHFEPVAQARAYVAGGAAAISVLTEPRYFLGALEHLSAVRAAVDVPVLRKDFILDPYQVYEARAAGADAILLLCALLDDAQLRDLRALAHALGMAALVEAHDAAETLRAVASGARVIGVNARDLRSFAVDTDVVRHLRPLVPPGITFVAESGIADALGAARARAWGADGILVGEALMRAADPAAKAHELASAPGGRTAELFSFHGRANCFVKLCGLTTPDHAQAAVALGVDAVGLVFFSDSPRAISSERAQAISSIVSGCGLLAVGLFVNEPIEKVVATQEAANLSGVQLSGDETPEYCADLVRRIHWPILKSLRLRSEADLARVDAYAMADVTVLLDAHVSGYYGGTGETGDWALAARAAARLPVILAGGLTPENVYAAVRATRARGVDVSSGIETDGRKDPAKMRAFVMSAQAAYEGASPDGL